MTDHDEPTARVESVIVPGPGDPWTALGFDVTPFDDGRSTVELDGTTITLVADAPAALSISGVDRSLISIDGVPVLPANGSGGGLSGAARHHPNTVTSIDHVVIGTDSIERTSAAITDALGAPLKRIREAGPVRQGFHRLHGLILEIVESTSNAFDASGSASIWGLALNATDLDRAAALAGGLIRPPKDAVQPGRRIASITKAAGLPLPVALMTPHH